MRKIKHLRWYIAGLLCLATIINYVDRMTWNLTSPIIGNVIVLCFSDKDTAIVKGNAEKALAAVFTDKAPGQITALVNQEYDRHVQYVRSSTKFNDEQISAMPESERALFGVLKKAMDDRIKALVAIVVIAFEIGYILGPTPLGAMLDRLGTRKGYPLTMAMWSAAGIITIFSVQIGAFIDRFLPMPVIPVVAGFAFCRFILGVGEAGNWPAAIKSIGEWFPARERSFAMGWFNSGSSLGAFLAPIIVGLMVHGNAWQPPYIVVGLAGYLWIIGWLALYHSPEKHPRITKEEYDYIISDRPVEDPATQAKLPFWEGLKYRQVRGVLMSRFCSESVWKFCTYWLPLYFTQERNVKLSSMFIFVALTALSSEFGNLVGGWLSSHFIKIGWTINKSRKSVMAPCGILMISALFIPRVPLGAAVAMLSVLTFCYQAWSVNMQTIPADVVPRRALGSTAGMAHMTAGLAGFTISLLTGKLSYTAMFTIIGLASFAALVLLFVAIGRIDPEIKEATA